MGGATDIEMWVSVIEFERQCREVTDSDGPLDVTVSRYAVSLYSAASRLRVLEFDHGYNHDALISAILTNSARI